MKYTTLLLFTIIFMTCTPEPKIKDIELQGHRGVRGHAPENTIPGFLKALEYGVDVLEMDVVISGDGQVVVSHEPWFSHEICSMPEGDPVEKDQEDFLKLFGMSYDEISSYDCGLRGNPDFPEQHQMTANKPLLKDVFRIIEKHIEDKKLPPVRYNIEIKSRPMWDNVFTPSPVKFSQLVYDAINTSGMLEKTCIQSFDVRPLQRLHQINPGIIMAFLVSNNDGIEANLKDLGFMPAIYSPNHLLLNAEKVKILHEKNLRVIPWTANEKHHIKRLIQWNVDGIITDYPNRVTEVLHELTYGKEQ